jgi:membrane protein involved in colicin uptake
MTTTETPVKIVIDLSKPEGEREQIIPLTAEEIAQREVDAAKAAQEQAEREAAEAQRQANKESAKAKLSALGLSDEEVAALLG